jgi:hypothetical protein
MTKHKIPTISLDRIDDSPGNTATGSAKEERQAKALIKGLEMTQAITFRLPSSLYQELREFAFTRHDKLNKIVVRALREHLSNHNTK